MTRNQITSGGSGGGALLKILVVGVTLGAFVAWLMGRCG